MGRILLIADNDGGHHANVTQQRADELSIEFVFLPPYLPNFNAIEPLWKTLKRKISPEIFDDKDHFKQFVTDTFLVVGQSPNVGYRRCNLMRASSEVNRQSMSESTAFRESSHAATS